MPPKQITVFTRDDAMLHGRPSDGKVFVRMNPGSAVLGDFEIDIAAENRLKHLEPQARARLATLVLGAIERGRRPEAITSELIERAQAAEPAAMQDRLDRLLGWIGDAPSSIGRLLVWGELDPRALAVSESTQSEELHEMLRHLANQDLIRMSETFPQAGVAVTPKGQMHIEAVKSRVTSGRAFVAMWFSPETQALYDLSLRPAIEDAGYEPIRIDAVPTLEALDGQIRDEIRGADFVVADMTHGVDGVRGSVYDEVGFAHGLGIPVIFTCRDDQMSQVQFDIRQYQRLRWTEPDELRTQLREHIEQLIGDNP